MSNVVAGDLRRNDGHVTWMQLFVAFCRLYEGGPMLLTTDEDILREVMVKGFHNFTNRKVMRHYANSILHFLHCNHKFREISFVNNIDFHGSLTKYGKLRVAHAPGMPGMFPTPPISNETTSLRSRHASRHVRHARAVMHVGITNPRWRGKCSRHSRRMCNPQFCVSGKRPIVQSVTFQTTGQLRKKLFARCDLI